MTRPNVLLVMTDQHRAVSTGDYGSQEVLTPHLDRLASRSVVFERVCCAYLPQRDRMEREINEGWRKRRYQPAIEA